MYQFVYHFDMETSLPDRTEKPLGSNTNTLTLYRRHVTSCGKAEPTLYPNTDKDRRADTCHCPINVHGYLAHHVGRIRHFSLETSAWIEADKKRVAMLAAGKLPGSAEGRSKTEAVSVEFAVEEFLKFKSAGDGKVAEATLIVYTTFCNLRLLPWCEANGVTAVEAFDDRSTTESFNQSWKSLRAPAVNLSSESRKLTMTILRMFLGYCVDHEWLKGNTARKIKPTKAQQQHAKRKRHGMELHEYQTVLKFLEDDPQMKALIELMFYTGMRVSDAATFCQSELVRNHRNNGWNADFIAQKNGNQCIVPLPDHLVGRLKALPFGYGASWFANGSNNALRAKGLAQQIAYMFKLVQKKHGAFAHHASAHTLRHTFAIQRLNAGVNIKIVADWMGDTVKTVLDNYANQIRSTLEMQEDAGMLAIETMDETMKAMGTADKVVTFKRKRA
jgi:site-specific recombinase XerD